MPTPALPLSHTTLICMKAEHLSPDLFYWALTVLHSGQNTLVAYVLGQNTSSIFPCIITQFECMSVSWYASVLLPNDAHQQTTKKQRLHPIKVNTGYSTLTSSVCALHPVCATGVTWHVTWSDFQENSFVHLWEMGGAVSSVAYWLLAVSVAKFTKILAGLYQIGCECDSWMELWTLQLSISWKVSAGKAFCICQRQKIAHQSSPMWILLCLH